MVALAPITNETPVWDVHDTFPKLHSRAREAKTSICTEAPRFKSRSGIEIWLTIYETCDRLESFTRDPIGFDGGAYGIYEYCHTKPHIYMDPFGKQIMPPSIGAGYPIYMPAPHEPPSPPTPWPKVLPPMGPPVPPKPPTIGGYGHYCGPIRAAFCTKNADGSHTPSPGQPPPIDDMDRACMQHDCCLADAPQVVSALACRSNCNVEFCKALDAFECNARYGNDPIQSYYCDRMKQQAKRLFHCP
jgi:hypothetical protein